MEVSRNWRDYVLLDSGDGLKLEKWGGYTISRPEPRAIWKKSALELWSGANAVFENEQWRFEVEPPMSWKIAYGKMKFVLKATEFKHTGVFPEQAANWDWLGKMVDKKPLRVLNLFAYTGGATIACAQAGAIVTHVDSSRPSMMWASENCKESKVTKESVRWIQDDALKFVQREIRRGQKYDAIIMDPPRFGRGTSGEIWKLSDNLPKLVYECKKILVDTPSFFLINAYTADLSYVAIEYLLSEALGQYQGKIESGELGLWEDKRQRAIPAGIFARWNKI